MTTEERRQQLLAVGRALFMERPYDQVSMDDVAQRANVSKALIFHYFSTKRDLYLELVKRSSDELLVATFVAEEELTPFERLTEGLERYLKFVEENAEGYVALLTSGVGVDPDVCAVVESVRTTLADRILNKLPPELAPHGPSPATTIAVRGFIGFVEAASVCWLQAGKQQSRSEIVQLSIRVLLASLGVSTA